MILAVSALFRLSRTSSTLLDFSLPETSVEDQVTYTLDILADLEIIMEDKNCEQQQNRGCSAMAGAPHDLQTQGQHNIYVLC